LIDDLKGVTLARLPPPTTARQSCARHRGNLASAKMVGKKIAELAKQKGSPRLYSIVAATSTMAG